MGLYRDSDEKRMSKTGFILVSKAALKYKRTTPRIYNLIYEGKVATKRCAGVVYVKSDDLKAYYGH